MAITKSMIGISIETATYVKQNFAASVTSAQLDPIVIHKSGKPNAVLLSFNEYQRLLVLEDHLCALCAQEAAKGGYLDQEESNAFLQNRLAKIARQHGKSSQGKV